MRESDNKMDIWNRVEQTDPDFTKQFSRGGGFRGTAINATYLARRATEVFGPIGIGWGVEIVDEAIMDGAPLDELGHAEKVHKVRVKLWYKHPATNEIGNVYQFGQTLFVGRNKNGLFTDEEAPKKSLTDAMSKCLSLLGFSADVHLGRFDDNKYVSDLQQAKRDAAEPPITEEQATELLNMITDTKTDMEKFMAFFKIGAIKDMLAKDYVRAKRMLERKLGEVERER